MSFCCLFRFHVVIRVSYDMRFTLYISWITVFPLKFIRSIFACVCKLENWISRQSRERKLHTFTRKWLKKSVIHLNFNKYNNTRLCSQMIIRLLFDVWCFRFSGLSICLSHLKFNSSIADDRRESHWIVHEMKKKNNVERSGFIYWNSLVWLRFHRLTIHKL